MRPREISNAKFLINSLNKEFGFDFIIDDNFSDESTHIDVITTSKKLNKSIHIQNVAYRDGTFYTYAQPSPPGFQLTAVLGTAMLDEERKESILKSIKAKEQKYQPSLLRDTMLLVEVTIPMIRPEKLREFFPNSVSSDFEAIYFVALPVMLADVNDKYGQTGYVYPLKPLAFQTCPTQQKN